MNRDNIDLIATRPIDKLTLVERGELQLALFLRPCRLRILIVADGYPGTFVNISFSHAYFGLSHVLDVLRNNPEFYVKFQVTRAHRQTDDFKPDPVAEPVLHSRYGPHFENFRFTQPGFNIDDYDQVWLFGARDDENDSERLTDEELKVLAAWMEKGGGLFATGDHWNMGSTMCARVPRARTMRRWTIAQGVPSPGGPNRHDTLLKGHDTAYTFDDESDDLPMNINLRWYQLWSWSPFHIRQAPHPVLCGTEGPIDILPDHPHEGHVFDDADVVLTGANEFTGTAEYPTVSGVQTKPEQIARGIVQNDHTAADFKGIANGKTFGVIGAYNGHKAKIGRVVVDSTWHHWFDVNLTGRPVDRLDSLPHSMANPKTLGFFATPSGVHALSRIDNYFRNVALWLASPAKQKCMFLHAVWGIVLRYPLAERLRGTLSLYELGGSARDAIGRVAGQCTVRYWILDVLPAKFLQAALREPIPIPDPDPCLTCPPFELFEVYALGGVVREFLALAYKRDAKEVAARGIDEVTVARAFSRGLGAGLREANDGLAKSVARTRDFTRVAADLAKETPAAEFFLEAEREAAPVTPKEEAKPERPKPTGGGKTGAARKAGKKSGKK